MLLALASRQCLVATVSHTGRAMARNRQMLAYALEEALPLAAEDVACDFITLEGEALGVAVEVASLAALLSALESQSIQVASVTPAALLALQHEVRQQSPRVRKRQTPQTILWQADRDRTVPDQRRQALPVAVAARGARGA